MLTHGLNALPGMLGGQHRGVGVAAEREGERQPAAPIIT